MAVTYANQYIITFGPQPKTDAKNLYHKFNLDALQNAMNDLTKIGSVKLWTYLAIHSDMDTLALSQKACEEWGIKKDSYQSAKKELIDKGYLTAIGKDKYEFKQIPMPIVSVPTPQIQEMVAPQVQPISKWDF